MNKRIMMRKSVTGETRSWMRGVSIYSRGLSVRGREGLESLPGRDGETAAFPQSTITILVEVVNQTKLAV
jgi:hypothetical protein